MLIRRFALAIVIVSLFALLPLSIGAAFPDPLDPLPETVGPEGAVVRIHLASRDDVPLLAALGVDIWRVDREQMVLVGVVGPAQYGELLARGFVVEVDTELTRQLLVPPGYPCYRTVEEVLTHMADIAAAYPDITELVDYGDSWEKATPGDPPGYDILAIRITNEAIPGPKPVYVMVSTHHARETVVPEMAAFYIDYLTSGFRGAGGYGSDPDVTWMVDYREIWIVPLVNPDGRKMIEPQGWWWRKNTNDTINPGCAWPPTAYDHYGVDINRNYSYMWAYDDSGSSPYPCEQGYRGVAPESEPETQAVVALGNDVYPNPGDTGLMVTLHSAVPALLVPWGYGTPNPAPDDAALRAIGCKWATWNNYPVGRPGEILWYYPNGTTDDWFYGALGVASFTYEIGDDFFEACPGGEFPWDLWNENLPTFIYGTKIAAPNPYLTVYGPDAHTLAVTPDPVAPGTPVQLTAIIEDNRISNSYCSLAERAVGAAEYFIDAPGADGTGTPLTPTDGAWNEIVEPAQATVSTAGLAPGTHYILVHGKSNNNYWGPFTAVFLHVEGTCAAVQIEDVATQAAGCSVTFSAVLSGTEPFAYAWDFGAFGASSAPQPTVDFGVPGTYPYTLTVSNCGGTEQDTFQGEVAVDCCVPPADAAFVYAPLEPVSGETVVFTGTATGSDPLSFAWALGDGATGSGPVVAHTYAAGGDYTVAMTASNGCGTQRVEQAVSVCGAVAGADFTWTPITPTAGTWVSFHASANGSPPIAYAWAFGDGGRGGGANVSHRYMAAGSYTVVLTATNCTDRGETVAHPITVTAPCLAPAGVDFAWTPPAPTAGEVVTLTGSVVTGTEPLTLTWLLGEGVIGTGAEITYVFAPAGTYTVTLSAANGCGTGTGEHAIVVQAGAASWRIYLPFVCRAQG